MPTSEPQGSTGSESISSGSDPVEGTLSVSIWRRSIRRVRVPRAVISIVVGLAIWEAVVRMFDISSFALVPPSEIVREFRVVIEQGLLWEHLQISLHSLILGLSLSALIAIPLGLAAGTFRAMREYTDPWILALYATPMVAFAPLIIISLGFGVQAKTAVVAFACFFPIVINTTAGVRAVDKDLIEVGTAFKASHWESFRWIALPGAAPFIFAGLRLAVGRGVVGLVVADLFGARAGLGLFLLQSSQSFNISRVFVAASVLAILGVTFTFLIAQIERRTLRWRPADD